MIAPNRQHSVVVKGMDPGSRGSLFGAQCCCFYQSKLLDHLATFPHLQKWGDFNRLV